MADVRAIYSVGDSIVAFLKNSFPQSLRDEGHSPEFMLLSSGELVEPVNITTAVTLYLYRVTVNEHRRNQPRSGVPQSPLALDLHYLLSVWSSSAATEHILLAWAMRQLHQHPLLDVSFLSPAGGWSANDVVQIVPAELETADVMRIWDALDPGYRLSVSYIARVVHIDPDSGADALPVAASRFRVGGMEEEA